MLPRKSSVLRSCYINLRPVFPSLRSIPQSTHCHIANKMHFLASASAVIAAIPFVFANPQTAQIYIQPVGTTVPPAPLAEITYDIAASSHDHAASVTSYEAPELPESASLVRIGVYDERLKEWTGATSVASVDNFGKGYSPHLLLSVDATTQAKDGERNTIVLGASLRGVRIDAGQTRDFGPQAKLLVTGKGKQPELNKPIVLSPEGKKVEKEEKSFLQKFVQLVSCLFLTRFLVRASLTFRANCFLQVLVDDWNSPVSGRGWWRRRRRQVDNFDFTMRSLHGVLRNECILERPFRMSSNAGR